MATKRSDFFKEVILKKWYDSSQDNILGFAKENGVPETTIRTWIKDSKYEIVVKNYKKASDKSLSEKSNLINQWKAIPEGKKGEWLRLEGIQEDHLKLWEKEVKSMSKETSNKAEKQRIKDLENEVKILNRELRLKDKALADLSARIILQKKIQKLWGKENKEF